MSEYTERSVISRRTRPCKKVKLALNAEIIRTRLLFSDNILKLGEFGGKTTSSAIKLLSNINSSMSSKYCRASSDAILLQLRSRILTRP